MIEKNAAKESCLEQQKKVHEKNMECQKNEA